MEQMRPMPEPTEEDFAVADYYFEQTGLEAYANVTVSDRGQTLTIRHGLAQCLPMIEQQEMRTEDIRTYILALVSKATDSNE